jgi:hypothetical protein
LPLQEFCAAVQVPQVIVPPQPSGAVPQLSAPQAWAWVFGLQMQTPGLPLQEFCAAVQVPQETVPPQPSGAVPQLSAPQAAATVFGVQPQVPGPVDEEQTFGAVQEPQLMLGQATPFTVAVRVPQFSPAGQAVGHWLTHWPCALQVVVPVQVPQVTVPPQPSEAVPQTAVPQA